MSKLSRTKGHGYEREIAKRLRLVFPSARRQLEYNARDANGVDIQETGRYKIQCKRGRKYASVAALKEVICDEALGDVPVLVTKADNERDLVVIPFEEFLDLLFIKYTKG